MVQKVFVTGAAGFIGSHLCDLLLQRGYSVIGFDNLSTGDHVNLAEAAKSKNFSFVKGDVRNESEIIEAGRGADVVVHLAAFKIPRYGKAIDTVNVNCLGMFSVLNLVSKTKARLVLASTSDIYGKNPKVPFTETSDSVFGPSTITRWSYATSKLFDEHLCLSYATEYEFPLAIARFFGSYGPRHHRSWWGGPQSVFIDACLRSDEIEIHGNGEQTRSFSYISDTISGLLKLIEHEDLKRESFNIGSTEEISILQLATLINELVRGDVPLKVKFIPYSNFVNYEDVMRRVPDISKATRMLGFAPSVTLKEGLAKTIAWHRAHPSCK